MYVTGAHMATEAKPRTVVTMAHFIVKSMLEKFRSGALAIQFQLLVLLPSVYVYPIISWYLTATVGLIYVRGAC